MTIEEMVSVLQARKTGKGKWMARCPAHADRDPSLSVVAGHEGRVLLHCFAGCDIEVILSARGLSKRDLFSGPRLTTRQLTTLKRQQETQERAARKLHRWILEAAENERIFQNVADQLLDLLIANPNNMAIAAQYHHALNQSRCWNAEWERREEEAECSSFGESHAHNAV